MIKFFYSLLIGGAYFLGLLIFLFSSSYWSIAIIILGAACIFLYFNFYK